MTWGMVMDVAAPVQLYDAMHARLMDRTGGKADGLLVHVARATEAGFQVMEVWETKAHFDRYQTELVGPLFAETSGADGPPGDEPVATEFDVRGLVVPAAAIAV